MRPAHGRPRPRGRAGAGRAPHHHRSVVGAASGRPAVTAPADADKKRSAAAPGGASGDEGPATAGDALAFGMECYEASSYEAALEAFELALELPGKGAMRLAGSPRTYACASEGEMNAAMYNMICCLCRLGEEERALAVLDSLLKNGFGDLDALRTDADLAALRSSPRFQVALAVAGLKRVFGPDGS